MPYVIDELAQEEEALTEPHVRRRLSDWRQRIDDLYAAMTNWLPQGFSSQIDGFVPMNETVMKLFHMADEKLPILSIRHQDGVLARIIPRALWIIGTNGRLDIVAGEKRFILIDRAENFSPPHWEIAPALDRRHHRSIDRAVFLEALGI